MGRRKRLHGDKYEKAAEPPASREGACASGTTGEVASEVISAAAPSRQALRAHLRRAAFDRITAQYPEAPHKMRRALAREYVKNEYGKRKGENK